MKKRTSDDGDEEDDDGDYGKDDDVYEYIYVHICSLSSVCWVRSEVILNLKHVHDTRRRLGVLWTVYPLFKDILILVVFFSPPVLHQCSTTTNVFAGYVYIRTIYIHNASYARWF